MIIMIKTSSCEQVLDIHPRILNTRGHNPPPPPPPGLLALEVPGAKANGAVEKEGEAAQVAEVAFHLLGSRPGWVRRKRPGNDGRKRRGAPKEKETRGLNASLLEDDTMEPWKHLKTTKTSHSIGNQSSSRQGPCEFSGV